MLAGFGEVTSSFERGLDHASFIAQVETVAHFDDSVGADLQTEIDKIIVAGMFERFFEIVFTGRRGVLDMAAPERVVTRIVYRVFRSHDVVFKTSECNNDLED